MRRAVLVAALAVLVALAAASPASAVKNLTIADGGTATLADVDEFSDDPSGSATIDPDTISAASTPVTLQANNDIVFADDPIGIGVSLNVQAGRSIVINTAIGSNTASFTFVANDAGAIAEHRDPGAAQLDMHPLTSFLQTIDGDITLLMGTGGESGDIRIRIARAELVLATNNGTSPGSDILSTGSFTPAVDTPLAGFDATGSVGLPGQEMSVGGSSTLNVEATSGSGGVFLTNTIFQTTTVIGGVSPGLSGLRATNSGDVRFTAAGGSVVLNDADGFETVQSGINSGDVFISAPVDLTSNVDRDAISSPAGSVTLTAGRDVSFGTAGANFDNDVRANRNVTMSAGRDVVLDGFADVAADDFGNATGGNATATANRHFSVTANTGSDASFGTAGGQATVVAGDTLSLLAPVTTLFSNGNVHMEASRAVVSSSTSVTAPGVVDIMTPGSGNVDLGSGTDAAPNALELSDAELDRITAFLIRVTVQSGGDILISAPVDPGGTNALTLGGTDVIGATGPGSVAEGTLTLVDPGSTGRSYVVEPTGISRSPGAAIPYTATFLDVRAGEGDDTFHVTASPTTTYTLDANGPAASDALTYDAQGRTVTRTPPSGPDGTIHSPGVRPVNFRHFESVVVVNTPSKCSDGIDNDGDGDTDFPADPGCNSPGDPREQNPRCSDGADNDGDGDIDFPADPGCKSANDNNEANPRCSDGKDNDGDGFTDVGQDPQCVSATDNREDR